MIVHGRTANEKSRLRCDQAPYIAIAQKRQLTARYFGRLQRELIGAKLDGKHSVEARSLLRALRLDRKRPTIGRMVLAAVLNELPARELSPEVLQ